MRRLHLVVVAAAMAGLACSGDDGPSDPGDGNETSTVAVTNNDFSPSTLSVPVNTTVTWQWDADGVTHNVTFDDGPTSGNRSSGSFPRAFQTAGTYDYVCTIHAAQGMTGTVTVTAPASGTGGGGAGTGGGGGGGGGDYP
jgi:plastocyanin